MVTIAGAMVGDEATSADEVGGVID